MSIEKIIRAQARVKINKRKLTKPVFAIALMAIFYMFAEYLTYFTVTLTCTIMGLDIEMQSGFLFSACALIINILFLFIFSPIFMGFVKMMYTEDDEYNLKDMLYFMSNIGRYFKCLWFNISFILRTAIPMLLIFSPVIALFVIDYFFTINTGNSINTTILSVAFVLLLILSLFGFFVYCTKYFIAFKLICTDSTLKTSYYFSTSKAIMNGQCMNVVKLFLSFTPWILLCITVLPIFYVLPYMTQAICLSCKWISELSRNGLEK